MSWKAAISDLLGLTVNAPHLPDVFTRPAPAPAKPAVVPKSGPVLIDRERNVWAFPHAKAAGTKDAQPLTDNEAAALTAAGINNLPLANRVKSARAEGLTQSEIAARLGVSLSYVKKIGGILSRFEVQNGTMAG